MKKLIAVAVLAAFSSLPYAAEKDITTDVVVVGQGAAGTAAAFAAAEQGAKVIGLEKKGMVGGTGNFSEGIFAVGSKMQRDYYIPLTKDEAFKKIMNYGHWRSNARLVRAFVDKSADTVEWMQKHGVKFEKLTTNYPGGLYTWHIYQGRGAGWINALQKKGKDKYGMQVLLNTPAEKLIFGKDGKVAGVVAKDKDGNTLNIHAKAVIIATGGFADNPEMMKKYTRFPNTDASESIISVCFNSSLLKYGGDVAVGAMTILTSVMQFAMLPMQGIGQGAQPIMSFNYGAGKIDRVKKAFWLLLKVTFSYSTLIWLAVMIFPQVFVGLFTSDATLLAFTKTALRIYMACVFLMGIQIACQMAFTSIGCAKESILVAVTRKFILLIPLIYIVPLIWRSNQTLAVYLAEPIADFFAVSFTVILFSRQFKKALEKAPKSSAQASADRSAQA